MADLNLFEEYKSAQMNHQVGEVLLTIAEADGGDTKEWLDIPLTSFRAPYESNVQVQYPFKGDPVLAVFAPPLTMAEFTGVLFEPSSACEGSRMGDFSKFKTLFKKYSVDNPSAKMVDVVYGGQHYQGYFIAYLPDLSSTYDDGNTRRMSVSVRMLGTWPSDKPGGS